MKLSEAMASLTPEQREAVEARFEALKIELAHAEGAAIIATDRPNEEFNERLAEMNAALRARVAEADRLLREWHYYYHNPASTDAEGTDDDTSTWLAGLSGNKSGTLK